MTLALVMRNLRHQRGLLLALAVGLVAWAVMLIQIAAELATGPRLDQLLELLPPVIRSLVNSQFNTTSFPAFVAFTFQHPAVIAVAIAFTTVAGTIPAGERDAGTLDLLLARPLPRSRYLASCVITLTIDSAVLSLSILAGIVVGLGLVRAEDEPAWTRYIVSAAGFLLLNLAIGGVALLVAVGAPRRGTAVARIAGVVFALYIVEVFADMWPPLAAIRWLSPFHYFKPVDAAILPGSQAKEFLVLFAVFALSTAGAFVRFRRRDV